MDVSLLYIIWSDSWVYDSATGLYAYAPGALSSISRVTSFLIIACTVVCICTQSLYRRDKAPYACPHNFSYQRDTMLSISACNWWSCHSCPWWSYSCQISLTSSLADKSVYQGWSQVSYRVPEALQQEKVLQQEKTASRTPGIWSKT